VRRGALALVALVLLPPPADAQVVHRGDQIEIARRDDDIRIDGILDDEAWMSARRAEQWYEFNPGDNVVPHVHTIAYLAYDDRYLYAAFEFLDPNPRAIRAPLADRDHISANAMDYGGLFLDSRSDGRTAIVLLVTPSGVQYDSVLDDASGNEDASPDFFWDSAARITDGGWMLEMRVPFSSLRYPAVSRAAWGIALFRNYPRDFRYQIGSMRVPRGSNCSVCLMNGLTGLDGLPSSGHLVAAPYVSTTSVARPGSGAGAGLSSRLTPTAGLDLKWTPNADTALDLAANPDFSQIEADTAQITANEQFALSYPEKRPFFLEGVELFTTPIRAVYTRSITDPRWGGRATGTAGGVTYTALVTEDAGGGTVILPGPAASSGRPQDFTSTVMIARARRDLGRSFISALATDREARDGHGHNRIAGPDFQWRYSTSQQLTGQWLFSSTRDTAHASIASHAADVEWKHSSRHLEVTSRYKDLGDGFRADAGFVPQVGYREISGRGQWTVRPNGFVRELRTFVTIVHQADRSDALLGRSVTPVAEMNVRWNGFVAIRLISDRIRSQDLLFDRRQVGWTVRFSPSQRFARIAMDGTVGSNVDFVEARQARGATVNLSADINPTRRLSLGLVQNQRWLNVDTAAGHRRLFLARVSRLRGNYMFTANSFVRIIAQYISTTRDPSLFHVAVRPRSATFSGSVLLAYKLNWQSVLFVGYGDDRELSPEDKLERSSRQVFVKASYAFQR